MRIESVYIYTRGLLNKCQANVQDLELFWLIFGETFFEGWGGRIFFSLLIFFFFKHAHSLGVSCRCFVAPSHNKADSSVTQCFWTTSLCITLQLTAAKRTTELRQSEINRIKLKLELQELHSNDFVLTKSHLVTVIWTNDPPTHWANTSGAFLIINILGNY